MLDLESQRNNIECAYLATLVSRLVEAIDFLLDDSSGDLTSEDRCDFALKALDLVPENLRVRRKGDFYDPSVPLRLSDEVMINDLPIHQTIKDWLERCGMTTVADIRRSEGIDKKIEPKAAAIIRFMAAC